MIARQLPIARWYAVISEGPIADNILARFVHIYNGIELKGESLRKKR